MKLASALTLALFVCAAAAAVGQESEGNNVNFTVPGALTSKPAGSYLFPGTTVQDMNDAGEIIGYYGADSSIPMRGFLRHRNGKITLLDDPAAGTPVSGATPTSANTIPYSISDSGIIVGSFGTSVPVTEAFLLTPQGDLNNFFAPVGSYYSQAFSINSKGAITGSSGMLGSNYIGVTYGYILEPNGQATAFQSPSASTTGFINGTTSLSINSRGDTAGWYYDTNYVAHSYVRAADGTFTEFEVPGAGTNSFAGAWPIMIDDSGTVIGFYYDNNYGSHSYVRLADGTFVQIDLPYPALNNQVFVNWVNRHGEFTGTYSDSTGAYHTWVRLRNGRFVYFTDPAAGTAAYQGTVPVRLNNGNEVAGYYIDGNNVYHGFLWKIGEN